MNEDEDMLNSEGDQNDQSTSENEPGTSTDNKRKASQIENILVKKRRLKEESDVKPATKTDDNVTKQTRRGRKKRPPRRYVDPSVKLNNIKLNKNYKSKNEPPKEFSCGVCNEVFTDKMRGTYHIFSVHNGLARLNSDESFTPSQENEALRLCLRRIKKLACPRVTCQKNLTTLQGYKVHLQTCGSIERVKCSICDAMLKPNSVQAHMKYAHELKNKESMDQSSEPRSARKAAVKARKSVKSYTNELIAGPKSHKTNIQPKCNSTATADNEDWAFSEVQASTEEANKTNRISIWKKNLEKDGVIRCSYEACQKSFTTVQGIKYHYPRCGKDFTCQKCGFKALSIAAMKKHAETHYEINNDEPEGLASAIASNHVLREPTNNNPYAMCISTFLDTFKISHFNSKNLLFSSWLPLSETWTSLSQGDCSKYLSNEKHSAKFKCAPMQSTGKTQKTNGRKIDDDWTSLPLFGSIGQTGSFNATMYVGGSVQALAWCPTPVSLKFDNLHTQYLAVAADLLFQDIDDVRVTYCKGGPGVIQLWNMGVLTKKGLPCLPKIELGIAHDYGQVRCMEWCNGGCYNINQFGNDLDRIGLLAIGCSNGNVYIYSVPKPEDVDHEDDGPMMTRPAPVLQLKPPRSNVVACLCLSWYPAGERNKIIAGFGNGLVCVWDLMTKSQLLWLDVDGETNVLAPYITFMPHFGPVSCVSWCPNTGGEHFSTGGVDKEVKIWSTKDLEHSILTIKKTIVTDSYWSPLACGVFCSYDDSLLYRQNRTYYFECGFFGHPARCLAFHNACVMKMTFSEWLNTIVTCDYAGEIVAVICYQYQEMFKKKKNHKLYKITPICQATIEDLHPEDKVQTSKEYPNLEIRLSTYDEVTKCKGIVFHDSPLNNFRNLPNDQASRVCSANGLSPQPFLHYNLQSVNTVSWNPNCGAHFWLASGHNAGFVRLHCVAGMDNNLLRAHSAEKLKDFSKLHMTENSDCDNSSNNSFAGHDIDSPVGNAPLRTSNLICSTPKLDQNLRAFPMSSPISDQDSNCSEESTDWPNLPEVSNTSPRNH